MTHKIVSEMTYNVSSGTLNPTMLLYDEASVPGVVCLALLGDAAGGGVPCTTW